MVRARILAIWKVEQLGMAYYEFYWTDETVEHLAEHGVTVEDFQDVVSEPEEVGESRSSGRPCC